MYFPFFATMCVFARRSRPLLEFQAERLPFCRRRISGKKVRASGHKSALIKSPFNIPEPCMRKHSAPVDTHKLPRYWIFRLFSPRARQRDARHNVKPPVARQQLEYLIRSFSLFFSFIFLFFLLYSNTLMTESVRASPNMIHNSSVAFFVGAILCRDSPAQLSRPINSR